MASIPYGWLVDTAINRGWASTTLARKVSVSIGMLGPAGFLVWMAWVGCDQTMAVVILCLAQTFNAAIFSGSFVSLAFK